jgi:hypothetical protein
MLWKLLAESPSGTEPSCPRTPPCNPRWAPQHPRQQGFCGSMGSMSRRKQVQTHVPTQAHSISYASTDSYAYRILEGLYHIIFGVVFSTFRARSMDWVLSVLCRCRVSRGAEVPYPQTQIPRNDGYLSHMQSLCKDLKGLGFRVP